MTQSGRRVIATLTDELDMTLWTLRNQPGEKAAEGFRKLISAAESRMEPILSVAQQKRLAQIRLSVAGVSALVVEWWTKKRGTEESGD